MESKCNRCHGTGKVFDCQQWPYCGCPDGTMKSDCPGKSKCCPECVTDEKVNHDRTG